MAEESTYNQDINELSDGLDQDSAPINQPKGTYRFALNTVQEARDGQHKFKSNEKRNLAYGNFPMGYYPIGNCYFGDDNNFVILKNPELDIDELGVISKDDVYTTIVNTKILKLRLTNQCDILFRVRRGNEIVFYWVDSYNRARTFNISRPYNFYSQAFQAYIRGGGNPDTYVGEKWDAASFDLIKSYTKIPEFSDVEIIETGNILPGSYNFGIQYVDEDLNPTAWVTTSNTINIFNDSTSNTYGNIRGSRNVVSDAQTFPATNKSIKLIISNLDQSFPFYRVAIIQSNNNIGEVNKVLASDLFSTSNSTFIYTGNDSKLVEVQLGDILIDKEVIFAPHHIEQLENRLLLSYTQGKGINWCDFQKFASKISSDLTTKEVLLNNVLSDPNVKNAKSTFMFRGYMPGEVYSFGVVYVFTDGTISPTFTVPGKNVLNTASLMQYHEITGEYLDVHNCSNNGYWGIDASGETLLGKNIRHHRFPFRNQVSKPLFTKSSVVNTINRYILSVEITLNPAWVSPDIDPSTGNPYPNSYPVAPDGSALLIDYTFNYQVNGVTGTNDVSGELTDVDVLIPNTLILYDGTIALDVMTGTDHQILEPTSQLAGYQVLGNERFIITETYGTSVIDTSLDNDLSEIFGIEFSNITRPHPDVIGFYIVRNERTDDDRIIIDNALFGPMVENNQYRSFGLLMPKQFYHVTRNCYPIDTIPTIPTPSPLQYSTQSMWIYSPEHQYFGKKMDFNDIRVEGKYSQSRIDLPTISNNGTSQCNGGNSRGVYIQDVQAGTSYNPDINKKKDKDDDGFDLIIGYRNSEVTYATNDTIVFPDKKKLIYLNAAFYQAFENSIYYNVSVDNKIGIYIIDTGIIDLYNIFLDPLTDTTGRNPRNHLVYGSLTKDNISSYSNFISRPYFKEHNNAILFGTSDRVDNVKIFNGDSMISCTNIVSSTFNDMVVASREKKSGVWKIIAGVVLIVVGVVVAIYTGGAGLSISAVGAGLLAGLAISYGISLAMSGIKFEQFKNMVEVDYEKGLKETVTDGTVRECIRSTLSTDDDTIRWFGDRVSNVYMETAVSIGLRSGLTSGVPDFIDSPLPYNEQLFRTHLTEKLTTIDRDQGSGRLYKGYASAEVYDMNRDYMRFNKEKEFFHLAIEYDCCSDQNEIHPTRTHYSEQSFQEEKTDNYRVFLPNNYRDIEGIHGSITDLYRLGNSLFIHTEEGLWQLPQNAQERVTNEIVTFVGTGELFNIPVRKVLDDQLGSAGTRHKWATIKTDSGVIFVSEAEGKVLLHGEGIKTISSEGLKNWFKNNLKANLSKQLYDILKIQFPNSNNPANPDGIGYLAVYDTRFERIILTKKDYALLPNKLLELYLSVDIPTSGNLFNYCVANGLFYQGTEIIHLSNQNYFEDKSFTISFSFYNNKWISWHSYLPNYYIGSKNHFYSYVPSTRNNFIWKHNIEGGYQNFYDFPCPHILEYVIVSNGLVEKTFEDLMLQTLARRWDSDLNEYVEERFITFNKILAYNNRQSTNWQRMVVKQTKPNPKDYYSQQIKDITGEIIISKQEGSWCVNEFRDYVTDPTKSLFDSSWNTIKTNYYIDKEVNAPIMSFVKSWYEREIIRGKYIVIRLKFDTFDNVNLITNFSIGTQQVSIK